MKFGDLSVRTKIICCVLCSIVPILIMTAVFLPKVTAVFDSLRSAVDAVDLIQKTVNVEKTVSEIESGMQGYILSGNEPSRQRYNRGKKDLFVLIRDLKASVAADPAGLKQVEQIEGILKKWIREYCEPAISRSRGLESPKGKVETGSMGPIADNANPLNDFTTIVTAFKSKQETRAEQLDKKAASAKRFVYILSILGIIVIIIVSIAVSIYSAHMITKPLNQATIMTEAVSQGDLSSRIEVTSDDELGRLGTALNVMVKELKDQIGQLFDGVNVLASSGAQISATAAQLAAGASRTSEAVTETTATVEEVKQAAKLSSEKAKDVAERSRQAAQISESGQTAVEDTVAKMDLIKEQTESIAETMVKLSEQSEAVGMIISSVQDIADQSNLLAVNASIEAARAGEQGKGFAVVAQEIKNLADQSKQSTEKVRTILDETRKWIEVMVKATEQAQRAVDEGVEQSVLAGESIKALNSSVTESSQAASLIVTSSEQQFVGVDQVSSAMASIEQAMTHNSEGTSHLEEAAKRLEDLGQSLKELVRRYTE